MRLPEGPRRRRNGREMARSRLLLALLPLAGWLLSPQLLEGQEAPPAGRAVAEALTYPELDFTPPRADVRMVEGVEVFHLHEPSLPLVDVFLRVRGGFGHFPREHYAAFVAMSSLLRGGGTRDLPPDSVDVRMETLALQTSFGGGGGAQTSSVNTLRSSLDQALDLWMAILLTPRFDERQVEVWRGQELESVRRTTGTTLAALATPSSKPAPLQRTTRGW